MMPYTDYTVRLGDLKRAIVKNPYNPNHNIDGYMRYLKYNTPSAEPEQKTGRWIELTNTNHTYVCSVCGRMLVNITDGKNVVSKNYPFCHCGADMRGEK